MAHYQNISAGLFELPYLWAIEDSRASNLIACSVMSSSKNELRGFASTIKNGSSVKIGYGSWRQTKESQYTSVIKPVPFGRSRLNICTVLSQDIGTRYIVTDGEHRYQDIYNFLMWNSKLPLLFEWTEPLIKALEESNLVQMLSRPVRTVGDDVLGIDVHGKVLKANQVIVYDMELFNEQALKETVTSLIGKGTIKVAEKMSKPLMFKDFDEYVTKYGPALVKALDKQTDPLSPLKGDLDGFAPYNMRLYPQQAACVNGIIALKRDGSRYGYLVEEMGCGKTIQGAATVDAYFNQEWLRSNPGKELKDIYLGEGAKYRTVVMAPSHLVKKWKKEIEKEIPGAEAVIIKKLDQLLEIRARGKERTGREWYLISKDFAKLGAQDSPIPVDTAKKHMTGCICKDCYEETGFAEFKMLDKNGRAKPCQRCGGHHFMRYEVSEKGVQEGLVCPDCGSLLVKYSSKWFEDSSEEEATLTPKDFAKRNSKNERCYVCGAHLWGVDAKPILPFGGKLRQRKWSKVSHWSNWQKKNRTTAWVLKGKENDYYKNLNTDLSDLKYSKVEWGPRRFAPAQFIKKYLKGYFDFCILDEVHKYENGGTAQSVAAQALVKVSDFTLALTGTISNGKADSLFYLFYMLDPRKMRKLGFEYTDVMAFSQIYGSVETLYEAEASEDGVRNSQSRGRKLSAPRVKPGISPKLFTDFLLEKAVFLNLSDMSKHLPQLQEQVVTVPCPEEVRQSYDMVMNNLKEQSRNQGGRSLLSTMLQFGLSYTDKPYGRSPIMHPLYKDDMVSGVPAVQVYAEGGLLPKEEKLVELVRNEINEDRCVFVYCAYTGNAEMSVLNRLKGIVEKHCNLSGKVLVMEAASPKAEEREEYIHQKASEGYKVIICNMKLVETGLDFCFTHNGVEYNYPTIIFYQLTYELSVMWQASRRHFRLNQNRECRTIYLVTEDTLQMAAVQIMAEKQVAASAIQGKFSADGLAAMASGVDPRIKLAQMLSSHDTGADRDSLENMFDVMNRSNNTEDDESRYGSYAPPKTYWEIMDGYLDTKPKKATVVVEATKPVEKPVVRMESQQMSLFDMFDIGPVVVNRELLEAEQAKTATKKSRKKPQIEGQLDLFQALAS